MKYASIGMRALLAFVFLGAGAAKLAGVDMMVQIFGTLGFGQWFRYATGSIEIVGAALLWLPNLQVLGASILCLTMVGATFAHLLILGPSALPAVALGLISATVLYLHRSRIPAHLKRA